MNGSQTIGVLGSHLAKSALCLTHAGRSARSAHAVSFSLAFHVVCPVVCLYPSRLDIVLFVENPISLRPHVVVIRNYPLPSVFDNAVCLKDSGIFM